MRRNSPFLRSQRRTVPRSGMSSARQMWAIGRPSAKRSAIAWASLRQYLVARPRTRAGPWAGLRPPRVPGRFMWMSPWWRPVDGIAGAGSAESGAIQRRPARPARALLHYDGYHHKSVHGAVSANLQSYNHSQKQAVRAKCCADESGTANVSRNSPEAICERILDLSREIEPAVGLISDLKESLRKHVEDSGEALNIEIKGKGQVTVSAGAEGKFKASCRCSTRPRSLNYPMRDANGSSPTRS
jgi:hypothetical protein